MTKRGMVENVRKFLGKVLKKGGKKRNTEGKVGMMMEWKKGGYKKVQRNVEYKGMQGRNVEKAEEKVKVSRSVGGSRNGKLKG